MKKTFLLKLKLLWVSLCMLPIMALAQGHTIQGVVRDIGKEPLIGVSITEKGTNNGTITDINGQYSISITKSKAIIVFSYLGYLSQEIVIESQKNIDITLKEDLQKLDEVVIIGYGTAKKSDLTGAVTRANLGALEKSPNVDVLQGLKGVVPGLNIGVSTKAGDSPDISIRGRNTISGSTAPLIVLDGTIFRGNIVDINPGDIESMDVLKDASSTAIYGSQAANGVIMITTKTAGNMTKPIIEYSGSFSVQSPTNNSQKRLNRDEYLNILGDIYLEDSRTGEDMLGRNPNFDPTSYFKDESAIAGYRDGVDTDWWDLLTNSTPYIQKHNINLRGKTQMNSYFLSFGFLDQQNLVKNDTYKRYNIRINLDSKVTSWFKIGTQAFFTISDFSGANVGFSNLFTIPALISPYTEDGKYKVSPYMGGINPLLSMQNPDNDKRYNISGNVYADVTIPWVKGLSYRASYSNNWMIYKKYTFNPYANSLQGQGSKRHTLQNEWTFDNIVTYKRDFSKHSVSGTLVYGVEKRMNESTTAQGNNFSDSSLGYDNLGGGQSDMNVISSNAWEETSLYNMVRLGYTFNDRYIFTGTIRRDGFSGFGENHKFGTFPSLALAWRITEESFMESYKKYLDNLKLRISYGSSGNRTAGRYSTISKMSPYRYNSTSDIGGYVFGDGGTPELTQSVSSMPNPNLKWETTNSVNTGLDFSFLNGRLFGTYDFYISNTKDLIYDINIPKINGVSGSIATNIGKLNNKGHEFSITGVPVRSKDFEWTSTFNFSTNKNKVKTILGIDANGDGKEDDLVSSGIFIGKPLGSIYDYNLIGMWSLDDYRKGIIPEGFSYGTYKVQDIDKDGKYTADKDRKIIGYSDPLYQFSFQNNFRYKNLELNVFINSIQGGSNHYMAQPAKYLPIADHLVNSSYVKFDYWTPENPNAKYRRLGYYTPSIGSGFSPYVSRSFVRLQELSLAYNIPAELLKKVQINRARVYLSGNNLLTISKWDGWDPEAEQGIGYQLRINGNENNQGYPVMKSFTVGLNLEF